MNIKLSFIFIVLTIYGIHGQESQRISVGFQNKLNLQLYRGLVEIQEIEGDEISIIQDVFDYDLYESKGTKAIVDKSTTSRGKLEVRKTNDEIFINNNSSRNLQSLKISVPKGLEINIVIEGFGMVEIKESHNPISVELFQGRILAKIGNTLSASIVRDGNIEVSVMEGGDTQFLMLSTYDGDIMVNLPIEYSAEIDASTELGVLSNSTDIILNEKEGDTFIQKNGLNSEELKGKVYSGIIKDGKNKIFIKNIKGKIALSRTR